MLVVVAALALGLAAWQLRSASAQEAVVRLVAPAVWHPDGGSFEVRVEVEGVEDLGAFEFNLAFDPAILAFEGVEASTFLGSTGRSVGCFGGGFVTPQRDIISFACGTLGAEPPGPSGAGVLATANFHPVGRGPSPLALAEVKLADTLGEGIAAVVEDGSMVVGRSAGTPVPTPTPVGGVAKPASATPTATPGPGLELVPLPAGCSGATSTYPDETPVEVIADSIRPPGTVEALWEHERGVWLGYSPTFPEASDLAEAGFLDVVFVCVSAPGEFVRPLV